jgi:uncharacterized protein (TIGR02001 family)
MKSPKKLWLVLVVAAGAGVISGSALAQDEPDVDEGDGSAVGINIDLGWASHYVFRGWNVFQEGEQLDPNGLIAPGITWSIFDTGLYLGWWAAFQTNGDNIGDNIDGALGAEQDLFAGWEYAIIDELTISVGLVYYFYPGAEEDIAGAKVPSYLEPGAGVCWSTVVDLGLNVSYFLGIQDEPGIRGISYLYLNPYVGKSFELSERFGLDLSLGYGFKLWKEGNDGASNVHDIIASVGLPIAISGGFYVNPAVYFTWTNIEDVDNGDGTITEYGFADEFIVYGAINVGIDF